MEEFKPRNRRPSSNSRTQTPLTIGVKRALHIPWTSVSPLMIFNEIRPTNSHQTMNRRKGTVSYQDNEYWVVGVYDGLWFDDPRPTIYVPHLTLLNSDPKWDSKLRKQVLKRQATPAKKWGKGRKSGPRNNRDGGDRDRDRKITKDQFGWDYNLFRDVRKEFSKVAFGTQLVIHFELQANYKCVQKVYINGGKTIFQHDTNIEEILQSDSRSEDSESKSSASSSGWK